MTLLTRQELQQIDLRQLVVTPETLPAEFNQHVLLMDKPKGLSSFGLVRRLKPLLQIKKIGHAGTLDPMATGLLICLVGRATKLMERFMGLPKTYEGTLRLGQTTSSYDAETPIQVEKDWSHLEASDLEAAREPFLGTITQHTPIYSAVKVGGERLYKKARRNETIELPKRTVTITEFDLTQFDGRDVSFRVACSKGTYIRSLAQEYGENLGVGAHLIALRRTHIGAFSVDDAWTLDSLRDALDATRESGGGHA